MSTDKINSEIIELQGYVTIATFLHYFKPGSLKLYTEVHVVRIGELRSLLDKSDAIFGEDTRRWLQKGESPYPGYCRAPGSGVCLPVLCNCKKLTDIWNSIRETRTKINAIEHPK